MSSFGSEGTQSTPPSAGDTSPESMATQRSCRSGPEPSRHLQGQMLPLLQGLEPPPRGKGLKGAAKGTAAPHHATRQRCSQGAGTERRRIPSLIELMLPNKALNVMDKIQATGNRKANRKERQQDQSHISSWEFLTVACRIAECRKMGSSHCPALTQRDTGRAAGAELT